MTAGAGVRTSAVGSLSVHEVTLSSILQAGDADRFEAISLALAVQRQVETFDGREGDRLLATHPAFDEPILVPMPDRSVGMRVTNRSPNITIGSVDVLAVSSSSLLGIGSVNRLTLESRTLNIRHIIPGAVPQVDVMTE